MNKKIVVVKNMSVQFGDFYAVHDVSFDVSQGEIFGFLGANGAGKTTTIRVLCGLLPASSGGVIVDDILFIQGRENDVKEKVGYMSQRFTLYDDLSVKENFDFAASLRKLDTDWYLKQRKKLLDFIGFNRSLKTVVKNLPSGIKQQVALCVALIHNPKIIFLDEPTAGVAPRARLQFWRLIKMLAENGTTVFVTTHYMDEAENCGRIALMRNGQLIVIDSPKKLKQKTFSGSVYRLQPRKKNPQIPDLKQIDMWQPYGKNFHLHFKKGVRTTEALQKIKSDWKISKIKPSLEDVFIKLVEGEI